MECAERVKELGDNRQSDKVNHAQRYDTAHRVAWNVWVVLQHSFDDGMPPSLDHHVAVLRKNRLHICRYNE